MKKLDKKQSAIIIVVLVVTAILAALIFFKAGVKAPGGAEEAGEHSEAEPAHGPAGAVGERGTALEPKKGPHNGKLFEKDGYGIEIAIFEQNVEPEFRIYTYKSGKPLDPSASQVAVKLERLGRPPQTFKFVKEEDYLKGDAVVSEPHSFKVSMTSRYAGQVYQFAYDQVEARVNMSAKQAKESGIDIQTAGPMKIDSTLQLIGEIRVNEDRTVHIVPRLAGLVESVSVNAGDQVRKGQVMAVISSQSLAEQRSELLAAQRRVELARSVYQREKKLWEEKISAEQDYLQARSALQEAEIVAQSARQKLNALGASASAGGNLTRYEIRSPINGTVAEKKIAIGETLKEDAKIFIVSDLSSVWADLTVQAKDLGTVKVGQKATVKATAFEHVANGTLSYIGALVGEQTRSANARVVLANPDGKWRPGLPVSVELVSGAIEAKVAVSTEAIQTMNYGPTVFGRYGENFEARPLELGRSDGKFTEVVQGLAAGEQYAAKNSFLLKADLGKSGASHDH